MQVDVTILASILEQALNAQCLGRTFGNAVQFGVSRAQRNRRLCLGPTLDAAIAKHRDSAGSRYLGFTAKGGSRAPRTR